MTNATVIKINDSSLPQDMVKNFREMLFAQFLPEDAKIFLCRLVECSVRFLSKYKSKDAHVTVKYTTLNTDKTFLFGLAADYIPPEGDAEETPGTWTVSACMNQEFLTSENAQSTIEYDLLTTSFCNEMIQLLGKYANLQLVDPKEFARITEIIFLTLLQFMRKNTLESSEEFVLDCEAFTVTGTKNAEGEPVFRVDLNEKLKQFIKDDSALEKMMVNI